MKKIAVYLVSLIIMVHVYSQITEGKISMHDRMTNEFFNNRQSVSDCTKSTKLIKENFVEYQVKRTKISHTPISEILGIRYGS